ncbi:metabotropic glutamate receptor 2-like [Saccoglossus kowalevskii]|uniref:Metabotropic glutamate receptor 4-like n=1 Tax=Saccoglossus kowalevskii TaxID=10224 RepID=A0ABM0GK44_SACKO|nr:PREDICTED: metabotropic glutamate receptor 4-like [Saccoglossus kowalevskii]
MTEAKWSFREGTHLDAAGAKWNSSTDTQSQNGGNRSRPFRTNTNDTLPKRFVASIAGDVIIGGLFPIHSSSLGYLCNPMTRDQAIHIKEIEAMLFTIDKINEDTSLLPGVTLGAHVLDTCGSSAYALSQAFDFIMGALGQDYGIEHVGDVRAVPVAGVVGALRSDVSIDLANSLQLFHIPQVSYASTSPELSDGHRFRYFARTVPTDTYHVRGIMQLVRSLNWTYLSVVYEDTSYGESSYTTMAELAEEYGVCIAATVKIPLPLELIEDGDYDEVVAKLLARTHARIVVVYAWHHYVRGIFEAVIRAGMQDRFVWVGQEPWPTTECQQNNEDTPQPSSPLNAEFARIAEGSLSLHARVLPIAGFREYLSELKPETNARNPAFAEAWEHLFACKLNNFPSYWKSGFTTYCTGKENFTTILNTYPTLVMVSDVVDAVLLFAHALNNMHRDLCKGIPGLCPQMNPVNRKDLMRYIEMTSFEDWSGHLIQLDEHGDALIPYQIWHTRQQPSGEYEWIEVGLYDFLHDNFTLDYSALQYRLDRPTYPISTCNPQCEAGEMKLLLEEEICCWTCKLCSDFEYLYNDYECLECPLGEAPDTFHQTCKPIPEEYIQYYNKFSIICMTFASVGLLATVFTCAVFIANNNTPVVKASSRELSYILLGGILASYAITFVLLAKPSEPRCALSRGGISLCFTLCYSALLVKTNRMSRLFQLEIGEEPKFLTVFWQVVFTLLLFSVEIVVMVVMFQFYPPTVTHHYAIRGKNLLICAGDKDATYLIDSAYPALLMLLCTVYAFKTRKVPEGFNEAKFIAFTMYSIFVVWLAFVPIYFTSGEEMEVRTASISIASSLCASVILGCLFLPKVHIILCRPQKNCRGTVGKTFKMSAKSSNGSVLTSPHNCPPDDIAFERREIIGTPVEGDQTVD